MHKFYIKLINQICRQAIQHPWRWLMILLLLTIPALVQISHLQLDTDLIRLLPKTSRAAVLTRDLEKVVSDGGFFTVMLESRNRELLVQTVQKTAEEIKKLEGVLSVSYKWPIDFIRKYRYNLIPNDYLQRILDELVQMKAEASPFLDNLDDDGSEESFADREDKNDMDVQLRQYAHLTEYHQSSDGTVMGILVRSEQGISSIGNIRTLFFKLKHIAQKVRSDTGIWTGIGGSIRNKLDEYDLITSDINRSGMIASLLIILILFLSFRSIFVLLILLFPLIIGLVWGFSLVPLTVGGLNLITAFLLLILFGMGVDYSIHLVKRFQLESCSKPIDQALKDTFVSTGSSVVMSGLTTALALSVLILSDFRGFSEFGIICSTAIIMVLIAMFTVLPVSIVIGHRIGFVKPKSLDHHKYLKPRRTITVLLIIASLAAIFVSIKNLHFNYYLANLQYNKNKLLESYEVKQRQRLVYSGSMTPGAIYLADNLTALDEMLAVLKQRKRAFRETTKLGRIRSLRDFSPSPEVREERFDLIRQIKEQVQGSWTKRVEGADKQKLIEDLKNWPIKKDIPEIAEIPEIIRKSLQAKDGSGKFLVTIHPTVQRRDGRNAMSFTEELYHLKIPDGVIGPVGETAVFAEILWVVTGEGWWLTLLTILGVFLLIWFNRKSLRDTLWILLPLMAAVVLSLGVMVAFGYSLNFFNLVVIPALFGMGVDGGVHYFRRWIEKDGNIGSTQQEMFEPLSLATITTMLGYSGMMFANHHGIKSIGTFACIGLSIIWLTTLFLLPGLLEWFSTRFSRAKNPRTRG